MFIGMFIQPVLSKREKFCKQLRIFWALSVRILRWRSSDSLRIGQHCFNSSGCCRWWKRCGSHRCLRKKMKLKKLNDVMNRPSSINVNSDRIDYTYVHVHNIYIYVMYIYIYYATMFYPPSAGNAPPVPPSADQLHSPSFRCTHTLR